MSKKYQIEIDVNYDTMSHSIFEKKLELLCLEYNARIEYIWNE